ncbi:ArsR/SmtB family transcription factor [Amycolatopsis sp. CA-230715]|uniref:ArsR/SmtB family transcription factor n=1 Tax=Amycolatopsis sp. CA-230715 TaxID=2745196 RepID=UPI001C33E463|nr:metalloregulator ArsR/SmtB family transcription factor [Amycolatopsis sp. CA-230715]QWF84139.1 hypothetical protein HUW46_07583 [Amycolatopsis sp. CA-230715]
MPVVSLPDPGEPPSPELLQDTAAVFGMLSAPARLHILWLLASGDRDVGTLAAALDQSVPTVSHHLAKLKLAGLVRARRDGKHQVYGVTDPRMVELVQLGLQRQEPARGRKRSRGA